MATCCNQPSLEVQEGYKVIKCVAVGDGEVGKTCLLSTFVTNHFPTDTVPTIFDQFDPLFCNFGGEKIRLELWDTAGQADYDRLRYLSYPNTNLFLVCFAVNEKITMENVISKWIPEITHHGSQANFILVGTKTDLRQLNSGQSVTREEAIRLMRRHKNCVGYMECSALTGMGVREIFNEAIRNVLQPPQVKRQKRGRCIVL